jgi:hypothetical protein
MCQYHSRLQLTCYLVSGHLLGSRSNEVIFHKIIEFSRKTRGPKFRFNNSHRHTKVQQRHMVCSSTRQVKPACQSPRNLFVRFLQETPEQAQFKAKNVFFNLGVDKPLPPKKTLGFVGGRALWTPTLKNNIFSLKSCLLMGFLE